MLEKKYDVETAMVIETSVTEATLQVAEIEGELVSERIFGDYYETLRLFKIFHIVCIGRFEEIGGRVATVGSWSIFSSDLAKSRFFD